MTVRRLVSVFGVCIAASVSIASAQNKAAPKKAPKGPVAPAKDPTPAPAPDPAVPGAAPVAPAGDPGSTPVQMTEDPPPADIEGKDENPDAPKVGDEPATAVVKVKKARRAGYPIEEAARPITLTQNMSEVSIDPHMQVSDVEASTALRARYGITRKVQLGLTYMLGGVFDDPASVSTDKVGFHPGKAVGLDVTVLLADWVAVRLGVPVYIDPVAVSIAIGAPMKWQFADGKYAIGALDDLLNIKVRRFVPSFYQEAANQRAANGTDEMGNDTIQSNGQLRFSAYGVMQYQPKLAFIGRLGIIMEDFSTTKTDGGGGIITFIRAGLQYSPRKYLDLGLSIGFDDLSKTGTFGPAGLLAFRI